MGKDQYEQLGVDSRKAGFGAIMTAVAAEEFPYAFCKMYYDERTDMVYCQHGDGVGSKSVQRYLHWRETGDSSVFGGDVDDCIEMNLGDIACSGLTPLMFTDNIAINKNRVPKRVYMKAINERFEQLMDIYASNGMGFTFAGGETADLPDQVGTYVFDGTIVARAPKEEIITCEKIKPGDIIMGLRSGGKCKLEDGTNSGIMSNGLTLTRHVLMKGELAKKYPEILDSSHEENTYTGRFDTNSIYPDLGNVSKAIMSPTRHFSIIVHELLRRYGKEVHGVVLNTGGGQTKCTRVGSKIEYVKDKMPDPDLIFRLIQQETGENNVNMYQDFNMGIGVDVFVPEKMEAKVHEIAEEYGIGCIKTGYCNESPKKHNRVIIKLPTGDLEYEAESAVA